MTRRERAIQAELRTWDVRLWFGRHPDKIRSFNQQRAAFGMTLQQMAQFIRLYFEQNRHLIPELARDRDFNSVDWVFVAAAIGDQS